MYLDQEEILFCFPTWKKTWNKLTLKKHLCFLRRCLLLMTRVKPTSVSQELYSEVQTQYLPQVLGCLLQPLAEEMEMLSLSELTHALRTCFKVLSKVQMPPSYLDTEPTSGSLVRAGRSRCGFSWLTGPLASLGRNKG